MSNAGTRRAEAPPGAGAECRAASLRLLSPGRDHIGIRLRQVVPRLREQRSAGEGQTASTAHHPGRDAGMPSRRQR
ncbi:MAG TPA: hypothetical protein VNN80_25535 [Polyangiaceae bacterium]|nr:hypothetical protein [Polyangiaceae bacterium]